MGGLFSADDIKLVMQSILDAKYSISLSKAMDRSNYSFKPVYITMSMIVDPEHSVLMGLQYIMEICSVRK